MNYKENGPDGPGSGYIDWAFAYAGVQNFAMGIPPAELEIDADKVRELLLVQHPDLAALMITPTHSGWDNAMFRLGEDLALRLPRRQAAAELVLHEQRWLAQLAPDLPLKIPVPVRIGAPQGWYPWSWSITPWIDGVTADVSPPDRDQGEVLAAFFHALHRPAPVDAPHNPFRGVPLAARVLSFDERVAALRGKTNALSATARAIWEDALAAENDTAPTWIHGDLHPRNVLVKGGALRAVIDWGDMARGDRASDLAAVWTLLPQREARHRAMAACPCVSNATWARARGWALLYAVIFLQTGLSQDAATVAMAQGILERLCEGP
jgi:aminoglycoside phosphotransferase (APT) family kinase protein